jgi:hypothetical protein
MKKLVQDRILKSEAQPLSQTDRDSLKVIFKKQIRFLIISYIPLAAILGYIYFGGVGTVYHGSHHDIHDDDVSRFDLVAPYVCGIGLLMLTAFFSVYYYQTAGKIVRDLRKSEKLLLYINAEKTDMGIFNRFYIATPIFKEQQVSVTKEAFDLISTTSPLVFEVAPATLMILRISSDGNTIPFY